MNSAPVPPHAVRKAKRNQHGSCHFRLGIDELLGYRGWTRDANRQIHHPQGDRALQPSLPKPPRPAAAAPRCARRRHVGQLANHQNLERVASGIAQRLLATPITRGRPGHQHADRALHSVLTNPRWPDTAPGYASRQHFDQPAGLPSPEPTTGRWRSACRWRRSRAAGQIDRQHTDRAVQPV